MPTKEQIVASRQLRALQAKKDELSLRKQKAEADLKTVNDQIKRHRASTKRRSRKVGA